MTTNSAIYRDFIERAYNRRDASIVDAVIATDYVEHQYPVPAVQGIGVVHKDVADLIAGFSALHLTIEDLVDDGDKVWSRIVCRAIDRASGKPVQFHVMDLCRFENGKMVEHWGVPDRFALLHQLGAIAAPAGA